MEIEQKYLVKHLPDNLDSYTCYHIEQGYLCTTPVIRIRKKNDDYILTYKSKLSHDNVSPVVISNEVELPLTKDAYEHLKAKTDHNMVTKIRYLIPLDNNLIAELDIFSNRLEGLRVVEVEFNSLQDADAFVPPAWFGENISDQRKYGNNYLSTLDSWE